MGYAYFIESSNATATSPASAINGQVWNLLEELKQEVRHELLDGGPLCQSAPDDSTDDLAVIADSLEIEWRYRSQLEARLRDIDDAQDRLLAGKYGKCIECDKPISSARITADPVISLCLNCQTTSEPETVFPTL